MDELPSPGLTAETTFAVGDDHVTRVFGEQSDPPGRPAAVDATPEEAVSVLGTPHVLARVEFLSRGRLRGHLPSGTGVVGEHAEVHHRQPVSIGETVTVRTRLVTATGRRLTFEGELECEGVVAEATVTLRVVERDRFRAAIDG